MNISSRIGLLPLAVASFFCLAGFCRAAHVECVADTSGTVDSKIAEPVFGYLYFPIQASFQRIWLENLGTACWGVARRDFSLPWLYLYGDYRDGDTRLMIVGDPVGTVILAQRGESCDDASATIAFLQWHSNPPAPNDPPYLSKHEIEGVFADLLQRYTAAFGGKTKFFAWLDKITKSGMDQCKGMSHAYCHPTWHDLPPELQAMLEIFRQADRPIVIAPSSGSISMP